MAIEVKQASPYQHPQIWGSFRKHFPPMGQISQRGVMIGVQVLGFAKKASS